MRGTIYVTYLINSGGPGSGSWPGSGPGSDPGGRAPGSDPGEGQASENS